MRRRLCAFAFIATTLCSAVFVAVLTNAAAITVEPPAAVPTTGWLRVGSGSGGSDESHGHDGGSSVVDLTPRTYSADVVVPISSDGGSIGERLVLLGGHILPENYLADIFVRDSTLFAADGRSTAHTTSEWTNLHTASNPTPWPARYGAVALRADASDPANTRILLIGGVGDGLTHLGDVWATNDTSFRSNNWEQLSSNGFTGRSFHCAAALDQGRTIVVWAGHPLEADTWRSVDGGRTFARLPISYWRNRFSSVCAVTSANQTGREPGHPSSSETLWMVGGETDIRRPTNEIWFSLDRGTTWALHGLYPFPGAARSYAAHTFGLVALAPPGELVASDMTLVWALVIHGGQSKEGWPNMLNDTWMTLDLKHWRRLAPTNEVGRSGHVMMVDGHGRLVMATGQQDFGPDSGDAKSEMQSGMETADVFLYLGDPLPPSLPFIGSSSSSPSAVDSVLEAIFWLFRLAFIMVAFWQVALRFRRWWFGGDRISSSTRQGFEAVPTDGAPEDQHAQDEVEMQSIDGEAEWRA